MAKPNFTPEQIITHPRQVEILVGQGQTVFDPCRQIGVPEQTQYCWRREYGGMEIEQLRRLKDLAQENGRHKRVVVAQSLSACQLVLDTGSSGR